MKVLYEQLKRIYVHWINGLGNAFLGDDYLGVRLRVILLASLGNRIGARTSIRGGSYFAGGGLSTAENCFINRGVYMDFTESITLGKNVIVGHGVSFITAHHEMGDEDARADVTVGKPISIGDGAWIGANVTILPGITIGSGVVVAAGCIVTRNIPVNTLVAGIPGKVIRSLDEAGTSRDDLVDDTL